MIQTAANLLDPEQEADGVIDTLIRWVGNERDAIRELLAELVEARAENAALKSVRG